MVAITSAPHDDDEFATALANARTAFKELQSVKSKVVVHRKEHGCKSTSAWQKRFRHGFYR
jgi:hypothetical protein